MNEENPSDIFVVSIDKKKPATHVSYQDKGWKAILSVNVMFSNIIIKCNLIRAPKQGHHEPYFYFFEMPCKWFKRKRDGKWTKINLINFCEKSDLVDFQDRAFASLLKLKPDVIACKAALHRD